MYGDPIIFVSQRFIPIIDKFTYLGSAISRDCSDEVDVNWRILKAGNAFGMIRKCLFSSLKIKLKVNLIIPGPKTFVSPEGWGRGAFFARGL